MQYKCYLEANTQQLLVYALKVCGLRHSFIPSHCPSRTWVNLVWLLKNKKKVFISVQLQLFFLDRPIFIHIHLCDKSSKHWTTQNGFPELSQTDRKHVYKVWDHEWLIKNEVLWHLKVTHIKCVHPCKQWCYDAKDSSVFVSEMLVDGDLRADQVDTLL